MKEARKLKWSPDSALSRPGVAVWTIKEDCALAGSARAVAGTVLPAHTHDYETWLFIAKGEALVTTPGNEFRLESGDILQIPAKVPHALECITDIESMEIAFCAKAPSMMVAVRH